MDVIGALLWLSLNIYYEARSEPKNAQIAVAQVTINRSKSRNLTIKEVVLQPYQFSWTLDAQKRKGKIPSDKKAFKECVNNALLALSMPDITGGATHFHEKRINPSWTKNMVHTKTFGVHKYYKSRLERIEEKDKVNTAKTKVKQYESAKIRIKAKINVVSKIKVEEPENKNTFASYRALAKFTKLNPLLVVKKQPKMFINI